MINFSLSRTRTFVLVIVFSSLFLVYIQYENREKQPEEHSLTNVSNTDQTKTSKESEDNFEYADDITPQFLAEMDSQTSECPNYVDYSKKPHPPYSAGKYKYPYMRPAPKCRTFTSSSLEKLISDLKRKLKDPDLARLTENALPNTLDTTILWHLAGDANSPPETFVVTGDIHAEWLRDSARQLSVFQPLVKYDEQLKNLIVGAIRTQEKYVIKAPYCNAFHPPPASGVKKGDSAVDDVRPKPDWRYVFECKYEIDSLASFLTLTNDFIENYNGDVSVITPSWITAYERVLTVLKRESQPSFDPKTGKVLPSMYAFKRKTNIGTETLPLDGAGNPVNFNTGLVRSAFRPSDDATILQFFVPGNAHMLTELKRTLQNILLKLPDTFEVENHIRYTEMFIKNIENGLKEHAIVNHPKWGKVYAYEVDGYGGNVFMDDANIPSLLSLPDIGFLDIKDEVYQNTRKMILSKSGNPYFLHGDFFEGIGGPHIGTSNAWPMSLLMRIRTTDDDKEILDNLEKVMNSTAALGLLHESVNVGKPGGKDYTRPWFAWCNSEFGKTILHLAKHKPHLIFQDEYATPYSIQSLFS
ncbi:hypothetical protein CLUG_05656 [Clavispora lusitaniae ATCC 42720]|uniref:Meiotically up-regulated protein n=1 Tax=Clavispora lusitaniae (strain ATCC 42720) TaxID=306902 RepID=C4YBS8_CLAL4|nr:uncharacterized protein CLUG_05656 [Clavispora lusitaniae ATCC 42720]EEQ41528.1 hypothetical protein CLUG_05656 [Clavispora lusitaniae ATCC 42720]